MGFAPVDFGGAGKILLVIGGGCVLFGLMDFVTGALGLPDMVVYFGLVCVVVGAYLVFVVPKDK